MKRFLYVGVALMIATLLSLGGIMVFSLLADRGHTGVAHQSHEVFTEDDAQKGITPTKGAYAEILENADGVYRILPNTIIIYDIYQPATHEYERTHEHPSPFLLGLALHELAEILPDWQILYFSPEQVHLRQGADFFTRQYIISAYEGFVAIFYDNGYGETVKEMTNRPVSALAPAEQRRLAEGIEVTGNDELMRALEDFGS
ncbi:MAG: hypothetical protein FWE44_07010 [Defluviitaleaceae bacterium]|nr:hypothetical protein [Defluviitaleaceae bacterium]